jgi:hypothetical protein
MCFFADNPTLRKIDAKYIKRNILKNKPDKPIPARQTLPFPTFFERSPVQMLSPLL